MCESPLSFQFLTGFLPGFRGCRSCGEVRLFHFSTQNAEVGVSPPATSAGHGLAINATSLFVEPGQKVFGVTAAVPTEELTDASTRP